MKVLWIIILIKRGKIKRGNEFDIYLNSSDILFTLAINGSRYKENTTPLRAKIVIIKETMDINLNELSLTLYGMMIEKLHIYSINNDEMLKEFNVVQIKEPSRVDYIEIGLENFTKHLCRPDISFMSYNKHSLYILRNGNYKDVKSIITNINGYNVSVGRGGGQKSHMISPLGFRLSCYLMALFNFDYKLINSLNSFNDIEKYRYLPY